jgi:hypothetical protein
MTWENTLRISKKGIGISDRRLAESLTDLQERYAGDWVQMSLLYDMIRNSLERLYTPIAGNKLRSINPYIIAHAAVRNLGVPKENIQRLTADPKTNKPLSKGILYFKIPEKDEWENKLKLLERDKL